MAEIRTLCVYCGSSGGVDPVYRDAATALGAALAEAGIELVFGGGRVGLMGLVADAVLANGGRVTGVIPTALRDAEVAHPGATEMIVTANMHDRKRIMAERADAFAVLPGGIGTLDETFEILTWRWLRIHDKPIFIVDIADYWRPLHDLLRHVIRAGFAAPALPDLLQVVPDIPTLMAALYETGRGSQTVGSLI